MAKRTFATIWQQIEKLHQSLIYGKKEQAEVDASLEELFSKEDVKHIIFELGQILMLDYENFAEVKLEFILAGDDERFVRPTYYDSKLQIMYLDPVKLLEFTEKISHTEEELAAAGADFEQYRKVSFLAEVSKMPVKSVLFLCIMQQVAISDGLTHIGLSEIPQGKLDPTSYYQTILWAFNELEKKLYTLNGIKIRTEYNVTWHESEWISL